MLILPAIDLQNGECVRLLRGDFDASTQYGDPFAQIESFARAGAEWVHIVDLDGAKAGEPVQHDLIGKLARATSLKIQCGGGVRERAHIESLLEAGATRVVVGSAAVRRPDEVKDWIGALGAGRVCAALDLREEGGAWEVAVHGWAAGSGQRLDDVLQAYASSALRHVLVTDISRDGALTGPNTALMRDLMARWPNLAFQASGGVSQLADLRALKQAGAPAAIVGRALYERRFTLEQALAV